MPHYTLGYDEERPQLPTEDECNRTHDYREFYRNHNDESIDTEPEDFFSWSAVPNTPHPLSPSQKNQLKAFS